MNKNTHLIFPLLPEKIDHIVQKIGQSISWVYMLLVVVIIVQVILRRGLSSGFIALEELQWHLYAIGVLFGLSYAQATDSHVRVDVFKNIYSNKVKHIIEITGICFLLLPFLYVVIYHSLDFVYESFRMSERSNAPSGLPFRWLIKTAIPISMGLLALTSISRLLREIILLIRGE